MYSERIVVITIDGPSGSGKGTISQMLARHLGFKFLDSGALYRLVALAALKQGLDLSDEKIISDVASHLNVCFSTDNDSMRILLGGEDVTESIRQEHISMGASRIAAFTDVRSALLERQREFATSPGLVADGRDMGTTVFPNADVKFFLTASAEARAERRFKQLLEKGEQPDRTVLINDIQARDARDSSRTVSPLKPADDATVIDSTSIGIHEVFNQMLATIKAKVGMLA